MWTGRPGGCWPGQAPKLGKGWGAWAPGGLWGPRASDAEIALGPGCSQGDDGQTGFSCALLGAWVSTQKPNARRLGNPPLRRPRSSAIPARHSPAGSVGRRAQRGACARPPVPASPALGARSWARAARRPARGLPYHPGFRLRPGSAAGVPAAERGWREIPGDPPGTPLLSSPSGQCLSCALPWVSICPLC